MNTATHFIPGQRSSLLARITTLLKVAPLALAFLFATGPAQAADNAALPGTWHKEGQVEGAGMLAAEMTFSKDGTFYGHIDINGERYWNFAGKWEIRDNWLHYDYTKSDLAEIPVGTKDKDQIIEITATSLKLKNDLGEEVYERKK